MRKEQTLSELRANAVAALALLSAIVVGAALVHLLVL
jgi:hypothetical protein